MNTQTPRERVSIVIMTRAEHTAMHESAKRDVEKIAQAAGVEMPKTVRIMARYGLMRTQQAGIKRLNRLLQEVGNKKDRESVATQTGIATGYANAMYHFDLMSEKELENVIELIEQAGEKAIYRIEAENHSFLHHILRKGAKA